MFRFICISCLLLCTLALNACGGGGLSPAQGDSEALLSAEGQWALVEEEQGQNPVQRHMASRKKVDPKRDVHGDDYTQVAENMNMDEDSHFRVLRLKRQKGAAPLPSAAELSVIETAAGAPEEAPVEEAALQKEELPSIPVVKKEREVKEAALPPRAATVRMQGGNAPQVTGVRVGEHAGKTRLVLDVSAQAQFTANLDASRNTLVVDLPAVHWGAAMDRRFNQDYPALESYVVQETDKGVRLVMTLKKPVKLGMTSVLPQKGSSGCRIVLDLVAL